MAACLTGLLSAEALDSWGWRIPFLLGVLIGPVGFYIRSRTEEPEEFRAAVRERSGSPLRLTMRHWRGVLAGFGITITWTVCMYFFVVYMPTYAIRELGTSASGAFLANSASVVVLLVLAPVFGAVSDRLGRRRLLLAAAACIMVSTYPSLAALSAAPGLWSLLALQVVLGAVLAVFTGVAPAAMAEVCPAEVRSTSVSISYSFAVAIFGGFASFIATWSIAATGNSFAPAGYVIGSCGLSVALIYLFYQRRTIQT
ncbi:MAG: MFS transporter [Actinopolymorphaceae bacterium]